MKKSRIDYAEYLRSEYWRTLRRFIFERDEYRCVLCNSPARIEAHHRTYERCPYQERLSDVYTLCAKCHRRYSNDEKRKLP